jgi:hypothetical protein
MHPNMPAVIVHVVHLVVELTPHYENGSHIHHGIRLVKNVIYRDSLHALYVIIGNGEYDPETDEFGFRHYSDQVRAVRDQFLS